MPRLLSMLGWLPPLFVYGYICAVSPILGMAISLYGLMAYVFVLGVVMLLLPGPVKDLLLNPSSPYQSSPARFFTRGFWVHEQASDGVIRLAGLLLFLASMVTAYLFTGLVLQRP